MFVIVPKCCKHTTDTHKIRLPYPYAYFSQFDTSATAVIMTGVSTKAKYEALLNGTQQVESK